MEQRSSQSLQKLSELHREHKGLINLMPLQTGGMLTEAAKEALVEFGDGYSVCDFCQGVLCNISNPPIRDFVQQVLPPFLGCEVTTITHGAREAKFMVMHSLAEPGDAILVDGNRRLGEIAREYDVPFILNGAYAVGRMPISMEEMGADFIIGSGHKSMAAAGPVGILGMKKKWEQIVLRKSGRHRNKDIELLGCTVRGVPLMTLMASFPYVKERAGNWDEQVSKAQWFSAELEKLGFIQLGDRLHRHDLLHFDAPALFEISKRVRERGYFLYKELKERGIWGPQPGLARSFKLSTFAADRQQLGLVVESFKAILNKYS
jgi:Cys-tRNA synthase (O-phospho-L-seryl-tRNA:Cys-tRNA synthase)